MELIYESELYHHGVKGMKWGVRKSKAQRNAEYVKKYKTKEIERLKRQSDINAAYGQRRIDRAARNLNKKLDKYGQPTDADKGNPTTKAATKYIKTKARVITEERVLQAEAKKVASMKLSDIKAEKLKVGRDVAMSVLATAGSIAVMQTTPIPVAVVTTPNSRNVKRKNRIDANTITKIYEDAFAEAARDVYG